MVISIITIIMMRMRKILKKLLMKMELLEIFNNDFYFYIFINFLIILCYFNLFIYYFLYIKHYLK